MKNDLSKYVDQANWPTEFTDAKMFAVQAITDWTFEAKRPKFLAQIEKATTIKRLQEIVIYPLLSGEGMKVIK